MSALPEVVPNLDELVQVLRATAQGDLDLDSIDALRDIVRLLGYDDPGWINADEARRVLGITSPVTIPTLARAGLLRSRAQPDGQLEVRFIDVLHERLVREGLLAIGGNDEDHPWGWEGDPPSQ